MAKSDGFSDVEKEAMRERAREYREARKQAQKDPLGDLMSKIAAMGPEDKAMAERIHELVMKTAPELQPKTWYGMPAWAKDGKVICFFQSAGKFEVRFCTFGFSEHSNLDEDTFWPTSWALTKLTPKVEKQIVALVKKAVS
jgi:uncharacterized protein YdhG (YjbR/CyaY superfamily)